MQTTWPFNSTCQPLKGNKAQCASDFECLMDYGCVRHENVAYKQCTKFYSLADSFRFYWDNITFPTEDKESILFQGKFCKSGLANLFFSGWAQCTPITHVKLSDVTGANLTSPYSCSNS
mmetsp:Transcript_856/g.503  ORF Transcript_856/g.503 Transcript_856/m.503 type:complete len:119 (+) Transcript_856:523-879(+)